MDTNWIELLGWNKDQIEDIRFAGYSFAKQGHFEYALKFFEVLAILPEENVYDLQTLGGIYLQVGNNLSALNYLEKALSLDPKHEPTLLNRTKALFLLGYKRQGLTQASHLERSSDSYIADQARALTLAYS
ncbi:type III secretion chaperone [Candidatus Neptunichlamydia sp. REUL1]|uniref:type III secretion chaperone n=1 Tax=Candidatus Neptunichlamydia sp. REUL1 TaxID=3064277 RepID=UPI002930FEA8|nr:type III secretion chaperone [Candidatus Neptunochlamydia sp. REUL1]